MMAVGCEVQEEGRNEVCLFIEAKFTYYKINHFPIYDSVAFSTFAMLCNHHPNPSSSKSSSSLQKENSVSIKQSLPHPPPLSP